MVGMHVYYEKVIIRFEIIVRYDALFTCAHWIFLNSKVCLKRKIKALVYVKKQCVLNWPFSALCIECPQWILVKCICRHLFCYGQFLISLFRQLINDVYIVTKVIIYIMNLIKTVFQALSKCWKLLSIARRKTHFWTTPCLMVLKLHLLYNSYWLHMYTAPSFEQR
jgi:hypothetical protein